MQNLVNHPANTFSELLSLRPDLQKKYLTFFSAVENNENIPDRVLTLCRARIEQIHGREPTGVSPEEAEALDEGKRSFFSSDEQAALVAAEKIPFQYHQLLDGEVDAIKDAFGNAGTVALLTALALFDVTSRLNESLGLGR